MVAPLVALIGIVIGFGQAGPSPRVKNPGLAAILQKMVKEDQALRMKIAESMRAGKPLTIELVRGMQSADAENTGRLRQIVRTYGWPTFDLVGTKAGNDAWLLVQHADHDPKFQRECLNLMEPLVGKGQVGRQNFAYLTDRVLLAEGKKQIYGTQFTQLKDGSWEPRPLEDPDNVDKRRSEMGMPTMAEYRKLLEEMYGRKPPPASN